MSGWAADSEDTRVILEQTMGEDLALTVASAKDIALMVFIRQTRHMVFAQTIRTTGLILITPSILSHGSRYIEEIRS